MGTSISAAVVLLACLLRIKPGQADEEKLIDMGYNFNNMTNYWPNNRLGFQMNYNAKGMREAGYWYQSEEISSPVHGGTHMDAPRHFAAGKWTIDEIPVENFISRGCVIDVRQKAKGKPDYQLTTTDIQEWEAKHGSIGNSIVLINFGWAKHYFNRSYYFAGPNGSLGPHGNDTSNLHFPGIHPDAAKYFAEKSPKVLGVGLDTASLDYGQTTVFEVHRILFAANIYGIENVRNLDQLPAKVDEIIVLPQSIEGSGGAPVRMLARINKPKTDDTNAGNLLRMSMYILIFTVIMQIM